MNLRDDQWLGHILGRAVFRVDSAVFDDGDVARLRQHAAGQPAATYWVKVPTSEVDSVGRLGALGFYVVDVNVTFALPAGRQPAASRPVPGVTIDDPRPEQHAEILKIAESCFRFDRFHADPAIPNRLADRIKREWIDNYLRKARGERLLVASVDGKVAGFLAVLASEAGGRTLRSIDLVGVDPGLHRRGVGRALTAHFIDTYRSECDELRVGTQAANVPSLGLYETAGFTIHATSYVLHRHTGAAPGDRQD